MADLVFNNAKGQIATLARLPAANDALIIVPVEAAGLEADATLRDYDDLQALLAGTTNEQTTGGRKTAASVTVTIDDTNDRVDMDFADPTWVALAGNAIGALLVCYDNDTTAGTDANITPLTKHDWAVTPDGSDVTATVNAAGFARAA